MSWDPEDPEVLRRRIVEDTATLPLFDVPRETAPPPPSVPVDTSEAAADAIESYAGTARALVYGMLRDRGPLTAQQLEALCDLDGNTVRPRLWELRKMGRVTMLDDTRPTASGRHAHLWAVV